MALRVKVACAPALFDDAVRLALADLAGVELVGLDAADFDVLITSSDHELPRSPQPSPLGATVILVNEHRNVLRIVDSGMSENPQIRIGGLMALLDVLRTISRSRGAPE